METSGALSLSDLMKPARVKLNLTGKNRDAVLEELVDVIPEVQTEPGARETLLKALHEREQLHSTGIGDGVALPHARNALVGLVDRPVIVFGRHAGGVPYGAIDGQPAHLFFLIVAPSVTQHLAVLARISRVLRDPKLRQNLLSALTVNQILGAVAEAESKMYG
ncbi:MAG: PTS sugar transporter subunit IIA [Verrucomicrobia bacterium]|jgi:mannitol/fructose-specific phosphotransferase system IIA component (Ntr-type)|nr:PTS sugar transporter subunit IIA [Verrucomicrobiota bacterium]